MVFVAALVWMLWFTHEYCTRMRGLALAFYAGVAIEALVFFVRLKDARYLAAGFRAAEPRWDVLCKGFVANAVIANVGTALAIGSVFMMMLDITRSSQRHKREAEVDHLTGLFNRRVFFSRAERAMKEAREGVCRPSVAVLDVDNMKEINDVYGHQCGDDVLRHAAKAISLSVRHDDVPARHGGDEFAVLFLHTGPNPDTLKARLEEYLEGVRACGRGVYISLSVGIARYPQDGQDIDTLLYAADARMYSDKATKRHRECARGECELFGRT